MFWRTARYLLAICEACRELQPEHAKLFWAIAAKWDEETELSGERARHSYQSLREYLETPGRKGRSTHGYSKNQVRRYLRTLASYGVIEPEGELVFRVPCMSQEKSVQICEATFRATSEATSEHRENRTTERNFGRAPYVSGQVSGQVSGHTSISDDDDISGAVIYPTEFHQGGTPQVPFAAFFQSHGFSRKQITEAADTLQDWSSRGATADLVKHIVALVDERLRNQGNDRPWSPKYYDREIRRRLNRESSGRSDASAGPGGGDEIDSALGPLH